MQKIYKGSYGNFYKLNGTNINKITFYDDNGIVHVCGNDIRTADGKDTADELNLLQILKTDKSFRKPETEQEFINKQMKKKINFSYIGKEKGWYDHENKLELFVYVDNDFVKVVDKKSRVEIGLNDYDFSKSYSYYTDITLDIDGQIVKHTSSDKYEVVAQEDLQKQAKALFDEVVRISYIHESEFNRIFNEYELVKRKTPLLTK